MTVFHKDMVTTLLCNVDFSVRGFEHDVSKCNKQYKKFWSFKNKFRNLDFSNSTLLYITHNLFLSIFKNIPSVSGLRYAFIILNSNIIQL